MIKIKNICCLCVSFILIGCAATSASSTRIKPISPYDYGLSSAKTRIDTYWVLYNAQKAAVETGTSVNYKGIERLEIEIPNDAKSIPLSSVNDFKGMELVVINQHKDFVLFVREPKAESISIDKKDIDRGIFSKYETLRKGEHILKITDGNLWVDKRKGYSYGHTRKDVLLIKNGRAVNKTVYPYDNEESKPSYSLYESSEPLSFENLQFKRAENSTYKTFLFTIQGTNNVKVSNVRTETPPSDLVSDYLMMIYDCTNVTFDNISIDGTYSRVDYSGYGISLNNVWNYIAKHLVCKANWGIFGNNNVNTAYLENCDINRFDVHCYGKDMRFNNVRFNKLYNQFSSIYGNIIFEHCRFEQFVPILYESAYNAYTPHDIYFKDCEVTLSRDHNYLITTGHITSARNSREPVAEKCFPNVVIKDMTVNVPTGVKDMVVFRVGADSEREVKLGYINNITVDGMKFVCQGTKQNVNLKISTVDVLTANAINIELKDIETVTKDDMKTNDTSNNIILGFNRKNQNNRVITKKINQFKINE